MPKPMNWFRTAGYCCSKHIQPYFWSGCDRYFQCRALCCVFCFAHWSEGVQVGGTSVGFVLFLMVLVKEHVKVTFHKSKNRCTERALLPFRWMLCKCKRYIKEHTTTRNNSKNKSTKGFLVNQAFICGHAMTLYPVFIHFIQYKFILEAVDPWSLKSLHSLASN